MTFMANSYREMKCIIIPPYLKDNLLIMGTKKRAGIWTWTLAHDERLHRVRMNWCSHGSHSHRLSL